jgi:hypothetical protein
MSTDEIYSEELEIASVHEPFRTALLGALKDRERTRKLLYSPSFSTPWIYCSGIVVGDYG